ncbi:helix-turn-helix domain-containing protein [Streptomyces roseifaciens]|uniref:helix-turn-helix domain-containing protein n=1 Tax=Streptomyces roseifaciens TaxID=1488406 RepID=UPI0007C6609E|nr:helix-turn-helix domain-containing protein [Streptomyces roseifaciens]
MNDAGGQSPGGHTERRSLAEKLEHLLAITTPAGQRPPSNEDIATAINIAAGEKTISATYVWQLRTGRKTNPTMRHLESLAQYFGVSAAYFLSDEESRKIDDQLALLGALKQSDARSIALRSTGLSESSRRALHSMIDQLRKLEGLPDDELGQEETAR